MNVITPADLAAHPGMSLTDEQATWVAGEVNALIEEAWCAPQDPAPAWVRRIALRAAARFGANPLNLESWTTSVDDGSVTERTRSTGIDQTGISLSPGDLLALGCASLGTQVGTIWTNPANPPSGEVSW